MADSENQDYEEVPFLSLGKGWVPLDYLVMVKCLSPNGEIRYREMASSTLHPVEALGMLETMSDSVRTRLMMNSRPMRTGDDDPWSDDD